MTIIDESVITTRAAWLGGPTTRRPLLPITIAETLASSRLRARSTAVGADPTGLGNAAPTGWAFQQSTADSWPLSKSDPVRVGGYRLVSRVGSGGMADVFYAMASDARPVAVKLLRAVDGAAEACRRERQMACAVDPACIAAPVGYGESISGSYLVMAHLAGYRCASTLVGTSRPAKQLWTLGSALAQVLAAVHARGIVHCDVKPANVLVRDDDVRLIDFGIARYVRERRTDDGMVACTRGRPAPEQLRGAAATPAVDVFAWGCLLAHLASGIHPFAARSETEWVLRLQSAQPDLHALPVDLDEVIRATLARDPGDRPSASDLALLCQPKGEADQENRR
jgi:serine/threonine protein kinase